MPVLHILAGPNGSGKSTYVGRVLQPSTGLPFINADVIAAQRWPDAQQEHAYEALRAAAEQRNEFLGARRSFITETVFSHPSKNELVDDALRLGYYVHLHVMLVPVDTTVQRVSERVRRGGHAVPKQKIHERFDRLWPLVARARDRVDRADFFDNHLARSPFRSVATYMNGTPIGDPEWPTWTPPALMSRSDSLVAPLVPSVQGAEPTDAVKTTYPDIDLARIQQWARRRVPEHRWGELKVEADVAPRHIDIVEVRPPWDGVGEHTRLPIARLRYSKTSGQWVIYWRVGSLKFRVCKGMPPNQNVQVLLDYLDSDEDSIFWG